MVQDDLANDCASDWDVWIDEAHLWILVYVPLYSNNGFKSDTDYRC